MDAGPASAVAQILMSVKGEAARVSSPAQVFAFYGDKPADARIVMAKWRLGLAAPAAFLVPAGQEGNYAALARRLGATVLPYDSSLVPAERDAAGRPDMALDDFTRVFGLGEQPVSVIGAGWSIRDARNRSFDLDLLAPPLVNFGLLDGKILAILRAVQTAA